jgi:peptide/nickel transport system substrate-binding protein
MTGPIDLRTSDVAFPGAVDAAQLFQQRAARPASPLEVKREPGDGYWSEVWNVQPFCASYWGGRPVQDQMYSTAYLSTADWNDTASSTRASTPCCWRPAPSWTRPSARSCTARWR